MADTRVQLEIEDWIRKEWLPVQFKQDFFRERISLSAGGVFDFDAVSLDRKIVASISTSSWRTSSGRAGVGKFHKLRSDMLFLLMSQAERQLLVLTEKDMYERCLKEAEGGRAPSSIEFLLVDLPDELKKNLNSARKKASNEVQPKRE